MSKTEVPQRSAPSTGGFLCHLTEAITLNLERKPYYAAQTDGLSKKLSNRLIWTERLTLPVAWYFDLRARQFNRRGIGVVRDDFASMDDIAPPDASPPNRGVASPADFRWCRKALDTYRREAIEANQSDEFDEVCRKTVQLLDIVRDLEETSGTSFAMVRHVAESAGMAAHNARRWAELSDGRTVALSRQLVWVQVRPIAASLRFDRLAQPLHASGCGILVNDVPPIPFVDSYCRQDSDSGSFNDATSPS